MRMRLVVIACFMSFVAACAQVPKQSVELSTTIGRDLDTVHQSHRQLAQLLFNRMLKDVDRFVDDVYAPYQIRAVMAHQAELANSAEVAQQQKSLLPAINEAFRPDAERQLQEAVLRAMGAMVQAIHNDVESKRAELAEPIKAQEKEVLESIDRSYQQIHYANSIVTGYLSSIVKINDVQNELLRAMGVDRDLNKEIGDSLAKASEQVSVIVDKAETTDNKLDKAEEDARKIKDTIENLRKKLKKPAKEA